jgi:hypothetical protein
LGTRDWELGTRDWGLGTGDWGVEASSEQRGIGQAGIGSSVQLAAAARSRRRRFA